MLWPLICLATSATAPAAEGGSLAVTMEVSPEMVRPGDLLFVTVTATNRGDEPVLLSTWYGRELSTLGYELIHQESRYSFHWRGGQASGAAGTKWLPPGESRLVVCDALEFPPADHFSRDFWAELLASPERPYLRATLRQRETEPREVSIAGPEMVGRPKAEAEWLGRLFAESARRRAHGSMPEGFDLVRPHPADFGLASLCASGEVVSSLLSAEAKLSAGSLRDVVRLTNAMRAIYQGETEPARLDAVGDLLGWLDGLPEIERHYFAMRIVSWCANRGPWERPVFDLEAEILGRLPERCYGHEDYRAYWRGQLTGGCPPFAEYLEELERDAP